MEGNNPAPAPRETGTKFQINSTKLYVPVVSLSINDNIKSLENHEARISKNSFLE